MTAPTFQDAPNTVAVTTEADLLASGGTAGRDTAGVDTILINIRNSNTSNAATIKIYSAASDTGTPAAWSQTYSVAAKSGGVDGMKQILIRGYRGGNIRVTGSSTAATLATDIAGYTSPAGVAAFQVIVDGVVQGGGTGGTISGALSQSGGTIALSATGTASLDSTGALTIGATSTSIAIGATGVADSHPGGLTVGSAKAVTGSGAMAVEATGALSLGANASTTSIAVGQASVVANFVGGLTVASAKAVTGLGAMAVEAASGSTLTVGGASNAVALGQAGKSTTVAGKLVLSQGLVLPVTTPTAGAYNALVTDALIKLPTQSGGITVTLPVSVAGQVYLIEANSDGAAHNITIAITGGTVNGTATITTNYGRRIVTCDGTNAISL